jgi:hypothetical protein
VGSKAEHQKKCKLFNFYCLGSGYFKSHGSTKVANIVQLRDNNNSTERIHPSARWGENMHPHIACAPLEHCNAWQVKGKVFTKDQKQAISNQIYI